MDTGIKIVGKVPGDRAPRKGHRDEALEKRRWIRSSEEGSLVTFGFLEGGGLKLSSRAVGFLAHLPGWNHLWAVNRRRSIDSVGCDPSGGARAARAFYGARVAEVSLCLAGLRVWPDAGLGLSPEPHEPWYFTFSRRLFSDLLRGDTLAIRSYQSAAKYGFRGRLPGANYGVVLQNERDTRLAARTTALLARYALEVEDALGVSPRQFGGLRPVKIVAHGVGQSRVVGVLDVRTHQIFFLGACNDLASEREQRLSRLEKEHGPRQR